MVTMETTVGTCVCDPPLFTDWSADVSDEGFLKSGRFYLTFRRRKAAQEEPPSLTSEQFGVDPFQDPTVATDQQEIHPSSTSRWTQTQQVHNLEGISPLALTGYVEFTVLYSRKIPKFHSLDIDG